MTPLYKSSNVDRSKDREYEDPILRSNHKIFLSHSGAQKEEFVEQLCVDLERRHRFPFFDKRPSSLPKGERFPTLLKDVVAQCEMMVVVVSEEYFTSKWPMIELHGFMQASKKNQNLKILPLFFGLNVDEFSNTRRQKGWFKKWEKMAKGDARIIVDEWKQSLELIVPFNGLVYDRDSKEVVAYRKEVVSNICKAVPADIKFDESHVQGRSKLCQVVRQHLESIPDSTKILGVRVIGLYGVGGMGKTQICKIMCNELDGEFDGKVCHVELGNQSEHKLVKKVLIALTNTIVEVVEEVAKDKCRDVLSNYMIWKQKTFLTIDNVWDDFDSLEQAKSYLRAPFVEGSWVVVTSRFKKTLLSLNMDENACFEMPELEEDDARKMFLYYAANRKVFKNTEDVDAIEECIKSCYFGKGEGRGSHYHPLSLKALGVFLQYGGKGPSIWVKDLQELKESSYLSEPKNPLFTILRSNFDRLLNWVQELFMDVALFFIPDTRIVWPDMMEWLCVVHKKEKEVIEKWLQHLVDSALLEHVNMRYWKVSIHDLYREFAKLESQGKLMPLDMEERRWVYAEDALPTELEDEPRSCWERLTRVCISESHRIKKPLTSLRTIEWKYCTKLVVLKLDNLSKLSGVLNLKDLSRLRSLTVSTDGPSTLDSIEGLEGLQTLTYFKMVSGMRNYRKGTEDKVTKVGQLPAALKVLEVQSVWFEQDVLALCTNLVSLKLRHVCASDLDLKNCTSLQKVELYNVKGLRKFQGFALELGSSLQSLTIQFCSELVEVCGLDGLVGLLSLELSCNWKLSKLSSLTGLKHLHRLYCVDLDIDEVSGLDGLVGLKSLTLSGCGRLSKLPSLTGFQCLRELEIRRSGITEVPNLSGLEQLEVIDASENNQLTSLQGFGDLPALKSINFRGCRLLCRLSDMSKLTNLKTLDLSFTGVELHEEDMRMLEGLKLLEPILVSNFRLDDTGDFPNHGLFFPYCGLNNNGDFPNYRLDFQKHKILCCRCEKGQDHYSYGFWHTWMESGWEEKDLQYPSAAGYPVGRGYKIRDVENIWKLIPGPETRIRN